MGITGYVLVLRCDGVEEELFSLCQKEQALELVDEMRREFPHYCFSLGEEYRVADDDPRG